MSQGITTRSLLVLRHAEAGHDYTGDDHGRALTARGSEQARSVGNWLVETGFLPEATSTSDALRTRQTCVWVNAQLGEKAPTPYIDSRLYLASEDELLSAVHETPEAVSSLLVVAHMPGVQSLSMALAGMDSAESPVLEMAHHWPTCGIARFEIDGTWSELQAKGARLTHFHCA